MKSYWNCDWSFQYCRDLIFDLYTNFDLHISQPFKMIGITLARFFESNSAINWVENIITYVEKLQLRAKFQTAMVSSSRFIWITNSSDHRRVWTTNLLHTKWLPNPLGLMAGGLGNYFVCKRFAVHAVLWSLEFVIQINLERETIAIITYMNYTCPMFFI